MSTIVSRAFDALLPSGRASALQAVGIRMLRDSALSLTEGARRFFEEILYDLGFGPMREDAIVQWEKQFGLTPPRTATLPERQRSIEAAWALTGAQGPGYIEQRLQAAGYNVQVTENLPVADLVSGEGVTFSSTSPTFTSDATELSFGQNGAGYLLGNGRIVQSDGSLADPIESPAPSTGTSSPCFGSAMPTSTFGDVLPTITFGNDVNRWGYVFIIEAPGGGTASIPSENRADFEREVVSMMPAHLGVILRVQFN